MSWGRRIGMRTLRIFIMAGVLAVGLVACGGGEVVGSDSTDGDTPVTSPDTTSPDTTSPDTTAPDSTVPDGSTTLPAEPSGPTTLEDKPVLVGWIEGPFMVEGADVMVMESYPIQVRLDVSGTVPTPCNEAFWRITDDGTTIGVELLTATDPDLACVQVIEEVELQIQLGSWAGEERTVELNGEVVGQFSS